MTAPNLPASLSREELAAWLCFLLHPQDGRGNGFPHYLEQTKERYRFQADAVRALVEANVRAGVKAGCNGAERWRDGGHYNENDIVHKIMEEGK